jgi:hypoxanthine phosphoribosyltransferase
MIDTTTIIDYTYSEFCEGLDIIEKSIRDSGWLPDYIVGIVRGGAVPAVHLSHRLNVPVVMVQWCTRKTFAPEFAREHNGWIPEDLHDGKNILVVDDIVDSGVTITELLEDWRSSTAGLGSLPVANLRKATIYYNTTQEVAVDYYHRTIDRSEDNSWIRFPWEK